MFFKVGKCNSVCIYVTFLPVLLWKWASNQDFISCFIFIAFFSGLNVEILMVFSCVVAGWAHVVCALYIPEVEFANVSTMEPIVLQSVPHDRYNKVAVVCVMDLSPLNMDIWKQNFYKYFFHSFTYVHVCRHVISVRTKAERVKQPQEPVWPATNMAVDRPSMSRGELHSHDINFATTKKQIVGSVFVQKSTRSR